MVAGTTTSGWGLRSRSTSAFLLTRVKGNRRISDSVARQCAQAKNESVVGAQSGNVASAAYATNVDVPAFAVNY